MKRIITLLICAALIIGVAYKFDYLTDKVSSYINNTPEVTIPEKNTYYRDYNYNFVQNTNNFVPYNYQDLLNIFYTVINSGYTTFTFYCPTEYEDCINDVAYISSTDNVDILTTIGNYVNPFNNFTSLKVLYDTAGEVTIDITHLYSNEDILKINNKIDEIWNQIVTDDMSKKDIINAFHDYIINNTKYDDLYETEIANGQTTTYDSSRAIGPLLQGYAICSGYTDLMGIILDRLDLNNFKIASETHVWNVVYIDDEWLHLDLTWDDPVSEDRSINTLLHKFDLISTATLESFDIKDHTFDKSIYTEVLN